MRAILITQSSESILDEKGEFHLAMIHADPRTRDLAHLFEPAQETLRGANDKERVLYRVLVRVTAVLRFLDLALDAAVRMLHGRVLAASGNDHAAPAMRLLFPDGLRDVTERPIADEVTRVLRLEEFGLDPRFAEYVAEFAAIKAAREAVQTGIADAKTAEEAHTRAYAAELAARAAWIDAYERSYAKLADRLGRRTLAEAYFRKSDGRRGEGSGEAESAASPPADASASAAP